MNPLLLELIRQGLRWLGVWLMTIGVPESIVQLTGQEDVIMGIAGFVMYAIADTSWLVTFWRRCKAWWAR